MRLFASVLSKGVNIANLRKAYHLPYTNNSFFLGNTFHTSARTEKGRRTGQTANEQHTRPLSKKQKKRKAAALERRSAVVDIKKTKIKANFLKKQFESDEIRDHIKKSDASMSESILEMLMPDGLEEDSDGPKKLSVNPHEHIRILENMCKTKQSSESDTGLLGSSAGSGQLIGVDRLMANGFALAAIADEPIRAIAEAVQLEDDSNNALNNLLHESGKKGVNPALFEKSKQMVSLMNQLSVPVSDNNYGKLINLAVTSGNYKEADLLFDGVMKQSKFVDVQTWAAKIHNLCRSGRRPEALKTLDNLVKLKVVPSPQAYNHILKSYVHSNEFKEADKFWFRMHDEGVELTVEAFTSMVMKCTMTGEVERAFFYYDEMKAHKVEPNELFFANLLKACGKAPAWVNGYQDTIFDALALMEGKEMTPTARIYDSVIRAFGKSGDPVAAEYYFWEMRRKGLLPTVTTYDALLEAYALAQSVNAPKYGTFGRYARPPPKKVSDDERAMLNVGARGVFEIISSGVISEAVKFKGRRTKTVTTDMADDPNADRNHIMDLIHLESDRIDKETADWKVALAAQKAKDRLLLKEKKKSPEQLLEEKRQADKLDALPQSIRDIMVDDSERVTDFFDGEEDGDTIDFDALVAGDPELQELMKKIHQDNPVLLNEVVDTFKSAGGSSELEKGIRGMSIRDDDDAETSDDEDDEEEEEEEDYDDRTNDEKSADEKEQLKQEWLHAQAILKTPDIFSDPFAHVSTSTGNLVAKYKSGLIAKLEEGVPMVPAEKTELAKLLDDALESDGEFSAQDKKTQFLEKVKEKEALRPSDTFTQEYMDYRWDVVEFGRAPPPDYSGTLKERHAQNITRAELALKDMVKQGLKPSVNTLTNMVAVYGSGYRAPEAMETLEKMQKEFDVKPVVSTYRALVKTHILNKDMQSALACKDEMLSSLKVADNYVYGMIIESFSHRNQIVEALKVLEESAEKGIRIRDKNLRVLRGRCNTLGLRHPDLPADPKEWVHEMHKMRRNKRAAGNGRDIQHVLSQLYY